MFGYDDGSQTKKMPIEGKEKAKYARVKKDENIALT